MKVTRADWAGSVPWSGITNKPEGLDGSVATDVASLTARIAALEAAVVSLGRAPTDTGIKELKLWWLVGDLEPFQMAYEDIVVPQSPAAGEYAVGAPFSTNTGVLFAAYTLGAGYVRMIAINLSGSPLSIPMANYSLFVLNG